VRGSVGIMDLTHSERDILSGHQGPAMQLAMELVLQAGRILMAPHLIPVTYAHIDACFYNGQAHVDFAQFMLDHGAKFPIPAWTNNGVVSATHPELYDGNPDTEMIDGARQLMQLYAQLGCKPTWTCAPYQIPGGPKFGEHIVVGESNAVTYYNSAVGARTNKYGDYLDVACALVGKAPYAGLHTDEGRKAELGFDVSQLPERWRSENIFHHLLGHHIGRIAGRRVPIVTGLLPTTNTDDLKAISTAVASSGGVELWHGVGITPEAQSLQAVFGGDEIHQVTNDDLIKAQSQLSSGRDGPLAMVAMGTPHFSASEFRAVVEALEGRKAKIPFTITTSRFVWDYVISKGWDDILKRAGITIIGDICSYYAPGINGMKGCVMTNSAKWAYYAPGMLPVEVCFGSLRECVESAVRGEVWRDPSLWGAR
jgi:predicted aconitase